MSIQSSVQNIFRPQNRIAGEDYAFFMGTSQAGSIVNEHTAMQLSAVYGCVRIISEAIAQLPLHVYKYTDKGREICTDKDTTLEFLLHNEPNEEMTSFMFRETLMTHLLLWGNAYAQIVYDRLGRIKALYPLMPDRMTVDRNENGEVCYHYDIYGDENEVIDHQDFRKAEILHIVGLGFDGIVGLSPIAMAKNAIGMGIACDQYGSKFFANGARPSGILEHPGTIKDPQRIRDSWNAQFRGAENSHRIAVLEEGMKYTSISLSPEEAQFLESRKFQVNEIARIFRVPPHMLADLEKSSFSNIEQQSLEFVKYTLEPWIVRWEQALSRCLLRPEEKRTLFFRFNVEGLLRGDYASRMSGYATARNNGWMSANDIRDLENMNRIPAEEGGDLYLVNGSMTPLNKAGAAYGINTEGGEEG